jgi:hypothetical protein
MPKLPPLPTLDFFRGFDASARHLSFTGAGEELHLTQSALSRQIKTLEEEIGTKLFERAGTIGDGTPKPAGFDGAVMPMHVVVGLATALLVPWFARRRVAAQPREMA